MARLLQDQGKLSEAEPLFLEALEARRRTLGAEHPDTLASINSMATLLQACSGELAHIGSKTTRAYAVIMRAVQTDHGRLLFSFGWLLEMFHSAVALKMIFGVEPY
jgi:hypothetical protein